MYMNDAASTARYLDSWSFRRAFRPSDAIARAKAARASIQPGGKHHVAVQAVSISVRGQVK